MQHWHVLGAGAIGGLFASLLQEAGAPCTLLLRERDPALAQGSLTLTVRRGEIRSRQRFAISACSDRERLDYLLVCTKAYDILPAVDSIAHRLAPGAVVLLLANGLGYLEVLQERWPHTDFYSGSTTEGAFREGRHTLCHAGRGTTLFGQRGRPLPPAWFTDWAALAADCRWSPCIEQELWRKFAINCAVNPLTALYRCPNGELATRPALARELAQLCAEIGAIGRAVGQEAAVADLAQRVDAVLRATAANRSSMLQDVQAGRPTEIDYLTGYLLQTARSLGLPAARNQALFDALAEGSSASAMAPAPETPAP